jgi:hypothetical protein
MKSYPGDETQHERDCDYVTSDGPAPCTCKAGRDFEAWAMTTTDPTKLADELQARLNAKLNAVFGVDLLLRPDDMRTIIAALRRPTPPSDVAKDALVAAYTAGATDTHNWWTAGNVEREADFTEAAHDYADAALASQDAPSVNEPQQLAALAGEPHYRAGAVDIEDGDSYWHADIDTLEHGGVVQCWGTEDGAVELRDRILAALSRQEPDPRRETEFTKAWDEAWAGQEPDAGAVERNDEPTDEMLEAGYRHLPDSRLLSAYRAMRAALVPADPAKGETL